VLGNQSDPDGSAARFYGGNGVYVEGWTNDSPDLVLGAFGASNDDGRIFSAYNLPSSDIWLHSNDGVVVKLDSDSSGEDSDFEIHDATGSKIFNVDEDGTVEVNGVVVHSSDRNRKEGIVPINTEAVLDKVLQLPIHRWSYKGQTTGHVGPMAQDFYSTFGVGIDDGHIATSDAAGVALAAIQGLYQLIEKQRELIRAQEARIAELESRQDDRAPGQ
jgi:hypothetical protein